MNNEQRYKEAIEKAIKYGGNSVADFVCIPKDAFDGLKQALNPDPEFKAGDILTDYEDRELMFLGYDRQAPTKDCHVYCNERGGQFAYRRDALMFHPTKRNVTFTKHDGGPCPVDSETVVVVVLEGGRLKVSEAGDCNWNMDSPVYDEKRVSEYAIWSDK